MGVGGERHTPAALPPERPGTLCTRVWVDLRGRSGRVRKISPSPGFDPRTVKSVASRFTDWAIQVQCRYGYYLTTRLGKLHTAEEKAYVLAKIEAGLSKRNCR